MAGMVAGMGFGFVSSGPSINLAPLLGGGGR